VPSHYEERLQLDLAAIHELVAAVGDAITTALDNAVRAVLQRDRDLAAATVIGDYAINRRTRELDRRCHAFVARHLPSAGHLRFVSSALRLTITLERIGDYAATISRTVAQLSDLPPPIVARDIATMAEHARAMLNDALRSFQSRDLGLAQVTLTGAAQFTEYYDQVFADLAAAGESRSLPMGDLFALLATHNRLERVIHQAKNICEETIFSVSGRTKGEKTFQILFADADNAGPSQLAEHFTRKAFPNSGRYRSAGWAAADEVDPAYRQFAAGVGLDLAKAWPTSIGTLRDQLDGYQLIVGLDRATREQLGKVPYHTTVLVWDLDRSGGAEAVYRQLTPRVRELMERLRGDEAS